MTPFYVDTVPVPKQTRKTAAQSHKSRISMSHAISIHYVAHESRTFPEHKERIERQGCWWRQQGNVQQTPCAAGGISKFKVRVPPQVVLLKRQVIYSSSKTRR